MGLFIWIAPLMALFPILAGIPEDDPRNPAVIADNVGDTVGDPFKDSSGPSINILIKRMTVVSLVFAPIFVAINGLL